MMTAIAAMALLACNGVRVATPSITTALDPAQSAPPVRWRQWRPNASQAPEVATLREFSHAPEGNALVDPAKAYDLADLVDLALRANPATRNAWEEARAAAARLGIAEAAWVPAITANMHAGYWQYPFPDREGVQEARER